MWGEAFRSLLRASEQAWCVSSPKVSSWRGAQKALREDTETASKMEHFVLLVSGLGKLDGRTSNAIRKLDKGPCHWLYQLLSSCGVCGLHRKLVIRQLAV